MKPRTAQLLEKLASASGDDLATVGPGLADIVAMNCMAGFLPDDPGLHSERLTREELDEVKAALIKYIDSHEMEAGAASAFWCLGKFFDDGLREYFIERLGRYYRQAEAILSIMGQVETALSNLEEDILSDGSYSAYGCGKIMSDARDYLKREGSVG